MTFSFARCDVCRRDIFADRDLVAFQTRESKLCRVFLEGRQPWSGIRCICKSCVRWLNELAHEPEVNHQ